MAIHFDFVVDDIDAEMIMDCIHSEICRLREQAGREELIKNDPETSKALRATAGHLENLKSRMTNKNLDINSVSDMIQS